jgi:hypothetical protein
MSITVRLDADVERQLRAAAAGAGLTAEEFLARLVERSVRPGGQNGPAAAEEWEAAWRAWAAGHRHLPAPADDDRDGIYAGRGE